VLRRHFAILRNSGDTMDRHRKREGFNSTALMKFVEVGKPPANPDGYRALDLVRLGLAQAARARNDRIHCPY
jgi:hypothetical protein